MRILPRPTQSQWTGESLYFGDLVTCVGGEALKWTVAVNALKEGLAAAGVQVRGAGGGGSTETTVVLANSPGDHPLVGQAARALGVDQAALGQAFAEVGEEGYLLGVARIGAQTVAAIGAPSERGAFYGVQTLLQLLRASARPGYIAAGGLADRPAFPWRGIVEGFYGPPWTHEQRLRLLDFCGAYKMNLFIYAPKDDPYHRERWREPYPEQAGRRLGELIERARARLVDFCFAISPGLSMRYSSDEDFARLAEKCEAVARMGAAWIGLFLDDIPDELQHAEDRERFRSLGRAHAEVTTRLWEYLQAHRPGVRLLMCPTQYVGTTSSPYLEELGAGTPAAVEIMWTGRAVCSPAITPEEADGFGASLKRKPFVWDNYPVNDYDRSRLLMGPVRARPASLRYHLAGLVSNPMNEGEASKVALLTYADYLWNPEAYQAEESWQAALQHLAGEGEGLALLREFCELTQSSFLWEHEAPALRAQLSDFWQGFEAGGPGRAQATEELRHYLQGLHDLDHRLAQELLNPACYRDIAPYLFKLSLGAEVGKLGLDLLAAHENDPEGAGGLVQELRRKTAAALANLEGIPEQMAGGLPEEFGKRVLQLVE